MTPLTEKDWKRWVIDAAKLCGWRYAHFVMAQTKRGWRTPQEGDLGFPDMVLVHRGQQRVIFAELKVAARVSDGQREWLDALAVVPGVEAYVWKPDQREEVLDLLREKPP